MSAHWQSELGDRRICVVSKDWARGFARNPQMRLTETHGNTKERLQHKDEEPTTMAQKKTIPSEPITTNIVVNPQNQGAWFRIAIVVFTPIILVGLAWLFSSMAPGFYKQRVSMIEQVDASMRFLKDGIQLLNAIKSPDQSRWSADFEEQTINGWLAEDFETNHAAMLLPAEVSKPRIQIEGDQLRVGFRYTRLGVSTIVHFAFRIWVPRRNVVALELGGAWAGQLPLPMNQIRRLVEGVINKCDLTVTWKRNGTRLVGLIQFPRTYLSSGSALNRIEIGEGRVHIQGVRGKSNFESSEYAPSAN